MNDLRTEVFVEQPLASPGSANNYNQNLCRQAHLCFHLLLVERPLPVFLENFGKVFFLGLYYLRRIGQPAAYFGGFREKACQSKILKQSAVKIKHLANCTLFMRHSFKTFPEVKGLQTKSENQDFPHSLVFYIVLDIPLSLKEVFPAKGLINWPIILPIQFDSEDITLRKKIPDKHEDI